MKKSEIIALGVVAVECILIGIFEHALKNRVSKILDDDGSSSIHDYLNKKSQEIYRKKKGSC